MEHVSIEPSETIWLSCSRHHYSFALPIATIVQVIPAQEVTPVLGTGKGIAGATFYRNTILPVIDISNVFHLEANNDTQHEASLIILYYEGQHIGVRVDQCGKLLHFSMQQANQHKELIHPAWQSLVLGLYQLQDTCYVLLDISRLLASTIDDTKALYITHH